MKGFPVFPGFDTDNYNDNSSYDFDPQQDFAQFLEEARKHANHNNKVQLPVSEGGNHKEEQNETEKKSSKKKKSWKNALFSFWRTTTTTKTEEKKKSKPMDYHSQVPTNPKRRGYVSGPVYRNGPSGAAAGGRHRLLASGPLTSIFHNKKREMNDELPYVSLEKLNKPPYDAKTYGPVYLVS